MSDEQRTEPQNHGRSDNQGHLARVSAKYGATKKELGQVHQKLTESTEREATLQAEVERWKKAADTNAAARQVTELQRQLRERDHKDAFRSVAISKGVQPNAIDDAMYFSGYKPEGDTPDTQAIEGAIETMRGNRNYLFTPPPAPAAPHAPAAGAPPAPEPAKPGPAPGRGSEQTMSDRPPFDRERAKTDVVYAMKNRDSYVAAAKESVASGSRG